MKANSKLTLVLSLILSALCLVNASAQPIPRTRKIVSRIIQEYRFRHRIPGAAVAVYDNGQIYFYNYGVANKRSRAPVTRKTLFQVGSVTKVFTASLLGLQIQEGKLKLSDPLTKYLPAWIAKKGGAINQVTLEELATHTSSLPSYPPPKAGLTIRQMRKKDLYHYIVNWTPEYAIGTKYRYSDIGYGLLGDALATRANASYAQVLQTALLQPLRMNQSSLITQKNPQMDNMAVSYSPSNRELPYWHPYAWPAAGALISNTDEMVHFLAANIEATDASNNGNQNSSPLKQALRLTHEKHFKIKNNLFQALAWEVKQYPDQTILFKPGGVAGFSAYVGFNPNKNLGIVVLMNKRVASRFTFMCNILLRRLGQREQSEQREEQ